MFADTKGIDPDLIGQNALIDDLADHLSIGGQGSAGQGADIAECVEAKLKGAKLKGLSGHVNLGFHFLLRMERVVGRW